MIDYLFEELHRNSLAVINDIFQGMLMFIKTTTVLKVGEYASYTMKKYLRIWNVKYT